MIKFTTSSLVVYIELTAQHVYQLMSILADLLLFHVQFDADVVGCTRNPANDIITAIDTWNDLAPTRNNIRDDTQDVFLLNSSFVNGTISCTYVNP